MRGRRLRLAVSPAEWGVRTRNGSYVLEVFRRRLCTRCRRAEVITEENGRFVSLTYFDGTPVLHRR